VIAEVLHDGFLALPVGDGRRGVRDEVADGLDAFGYFFFR